jgi:hypothetical protein
MHVQAQSRAMSNAFNVANLPEQLIWTGVLTYGQIYV